MFKKIICIIFCILLNSFLFIKESPVSLVSANEAIQGNFGNGSWMHVDTFIGKDSVALSNFAISLKRAGFDYVIILAKDIDGSATFPSKNALLVRYNKDYMGDIINALNKEGINVYLYFVINTDPAWLKAHPEDCAYQAGIKGSKTPIPHPEKKLVNLTSKAYMNYVSLLIKEAISKYKIKGIQLDYMRYTNGFYGFSKEELRLAKEKNIDVDKIIDLTYKTFVSPGDWRTILNKYDEGDKDVLNWARLREDIIFSYANYIANIVHKEGKEFGTTLVSSGAFDSKFSEGGSSSLPYAAIHFGQSYSMISSISDFVTPMAYHNERNNVYDWITSVCNGVRKKVKSSCKVAIGLQANSTTTEKMNEAINASLREGYNFVLFRVGTYCIGYYDFLPKDCSNTDIYLNICNLVEGRSIKGISLKNTGGIFKPVKSPNYYWITENDSFKFFSSGYIVSSIDISEFYISSTLSFESANNALLPYIICSDEKSDFPTFTSSSFTSLSIDILTKDKKFLINNYPQPATAVKTVDSSTFINTTILRGLLNCEEIIDNSHSSVTLRADKKEIKFNSKNSVINYKLGEKQLDAESGSKNLLIDNGLFYVPLRRTLEFFCFTVLYNSLTKDIHCYKLDRGFNTTLFAKISDICEENLFLSNANRIYIPVNDFLRGQYLNLLFEMHLKGREIFILCNLDDSTDAYYFEMIFNLININEPLILTLDGLSYYLSLSKKVSLKELGGRELFTEFSNNIRVEDYKGKINLILKTYDSTKLDSSYNYFLLINRETLPFIFSINSLANLNSLYQPSNFQF
ncbi:MAG TPA: hypothetical protein PLL52_03540 [Caldisericia bacterium]|nr:hypothetical protein [Caldisericia bacterium]